MDLNIADMDGRALLAALRDSFFGPVVVLSKVKRQIETIDALDLGADDFVTKPFGAGELLARLRAVFRRRIVSAGRKPIVVAQELKVDLVCRTVTRDGVPVILSEQQYWVLARLAEACGGVLTHWDFLVGSQTDAGVKSLQNMRFLIRNLREKLECDPRCPNIIKTQHTLGYRLNVDKGR
jgi:two-component system KDP operon response regulator KdpE